MNATNPFSIECILDRIVHVEMYPNVCFYFHSLRFTHGAINRASTHGLYVIKHSAVERISWHNALITSNQVGNAHCMHIHTIIYIIFVFIIVIMFDPCVM